MSGEHWVGFFGEGGFLDGDRGKGDERVMVLAQPWVVDPRGVFYCACNGPRVS